ncbi:MAG TPA: hypothetical protein VKA84_25640 [Gemmatimonadaceae bacterium]|nr:hypothetical protein [Gemmatimonadaceae bacterium]
MSLTLIKLGGSLMRRRDTLDAAAAALARVAALGRAVVVPGGGALADAVRALDERVGLGDEAAHWMAVLAMDQGAQLLAARVPNAIVAAGPDAVRGALAGGRLPVVAPYGWLRAADPLPHSWDVTGDSIAAWLAGQLGAARLVLVKMVAGDPTRLADPYFARALPPGVDALVLDVARLGELDSLVAR